MLFYRKIYRTLVLNISIISAQDFYRLSLLVFIPWWKIPASRYLNAIQYPIWNVISKEQCSQCWIISSLLSRYQMVLSCTMDLNYTGQLNVIFSICNMPLVTVLPFWFCLPYLCIFWRITLKITITVYQFPMSFSDMLKQFSAE